MTGPGRGSGRSWGRGPGRVRVGRRKERFPHRRHAPGLCIPRLHFFRSPAVICTPVGTRWAAPFLPPSFFFLRRKSLVIVVLVKEATSRSGSNVWGLLKEDSALFLLTTICLTRAREQTPKSRIDYAIEFRDSTSAEKFEDGGRRGKTGKDGGRRVRRLHGGQGIAQTDRGMHHFFCPRGRSSGCS